MIRAILIDDEKGAIETLSRMLNVFCKYVQILGVAYSAQEARDLIAKTNPDLIFLDIKMPNETGFDLLQSLKNKTPHIIFTTAHSNYALKAIKFSALDYLLKPINVKELQDAVLKIYNVEESNKERYEVFKSHKLGKNPEQIVLPYKEGFRIVNCNEILRFEGERNYSRVYFLNGSKLLVAKTLKEFEELLGDLGFFRAHQSNLINMKCVKEYIKGRGGKIRLIDGSEIDLARSRKQNFFKLIGVKNS